MGVDEVLTRKTGVIVGQDVFDLCKTPAVVSALTMEQQRADTMQSSTVKSTISRFQRSMLPRAPP